MKREVLVVSDRLERVDLGSLDGAALCERKKQVEARLSRTELLPEERYYCRREVQRVDAELGRRKQHRRAELAKGALDRLPEHQRFLHAFLRIARETLPKEEFRALTTKASALAADGVLTCADCKEREQ